MLGIKIKKIFGSLPWYIHTIFWLLSCLAFIASLLSFSLVTTITFAVIAVYAIFMWLTVLRKFVLFYSKLQNIVHGVCVFSEIPLSRFDLKLLEGQINSSFSVMQDITKGYVTLPYFRVVTKDFCLFFLESPDEASMENAFCLSLDEIHSISNGKFMVCHRIPGEEFFLGKTFTNVVARTILDDIMIDSEIRAILRKYLTV